MDYFDSKDRIQSRVGIMVHPNVIGIMGRPDFYRNLTVPNFLDWAVFNRLYRKVHDHEG